MKKADQLEEGLLHTGMLTNHGMRLGHIQFPTCGCLVSRHHVDELNPPLLCPILPLSTLTAFELRLTDVLGAVFTRQQPITSVEAAR